MQSPYLQRLIRELNEAIEDSYSGSFECPNCGVTNTIDPAKIKNTFAYTDRQSGEPQYTKVQRCEQCNIPHELR